MRVFFAKPILRIKKNFNFKLNNSNKEDHDERNDRITAGIVGFACGSFGENI